MADTLTTSTAVSTIPSGTVIATDDAGASGHVQIVKLALSTDGSASPITADANGLEVQGAGVAGTPAGGVVSVQGVASGTALPVSAASLPLPSGAATLAEQQTQTAAQALIAASLSVLDDWDESDRAKVNPIVGQAGVAAGAGAVGPTVQRVTLASDDPAVTALQILDNIVAGSEAQVDIVAALPAGTNNIGDVDVLTVPADPFGANADAAATAGSTGSIQAKLRLMTSQLDAIKTAVETLDNAISGSEAQVDVVAALPAGTNNIGDVDIASTPRASTATITTQADQATNATLKAANANRLAIIILNDSTVDLYVKYGTTATSDDYTYKLGPGESYREDLYTGRIDGIWASDAAGKARITELTA